MNYNKSGKETSSLKSIFCNKHLFKFIASLIFIFILAISSASVNGEEQVPKTKYSDLEKEAIDKDAQQILKDYYSGVLGNIGNISGFNSIATKDNIAIINLTIDGKDKRILTKLNKGMVFGSNDLFIGIVNNLTVLGNIAIRGLSYYIINSDFGERKLFGLAATSPGFIDEGTSRLFNGISNVSINPELRSTIDDYKVYLSPEGRTKGVYVAEKAKDYFVVKGFSSDSNVKFSWMLRGIRKDYKALAHDREYGITALIDYEAGTSLVNLSANISILSNKPLTNQSANNTINSNNSLSAVTGNLVELGNISEILENASSVQNSSVIDINQSGTEAANEAYVLNSVDENAIVENAALRFGLTQEDVRKNIKFVYKAPQDSIDEKDTYQTPKSYMEVNGSVIIRIG